MIRMLHPRRSPLLRILSLHLHSRSLLPRSLNLYLHNLSLHPRILNVHLHILNLLRIQRYDRHIQNHPRDRMMTGLHIYHLRKSPPVGLSSLIHRYCRKRIGSCCDSHLHVPRDVSLLLSQGVSSPSSLACVVSSPSRCHPSRTSPSLSDSFSDHSTLRSAIRATCTGPTIHSAVSRSWIRIPRRCPRNVVSWFSRIHRRMQAGFRHFPGTQIPLRFHNGHSVHTARTLGVRRLRGRKIPCTEIGCTLVVRCILEDGNLLGCK